jgi:hypothetical protein
MLNSRPVDSGTPPFHVSPIPILHPNPQTLHDAGCKVRTTLIDNPPDRRSVTTVFAPQPFETRAVVTMTNSRLGRLPDVIKNPNVIAQIPHSRAVEQLTTRTYFDRLDTMSNKVFRVACRILAKVADARPECQRFEAAEDALRHYEQGCLMPYSPDQVVVMGHLIMEKSSLYDELELKLRTNTSGGAVGNSLSLLGEAQAEQRKRWAENPTTHNITSATTVRLPHGEAHVVQTFQTREAADAALNIPITLTPAQK